MRPAGRPPLDADPLIGAVTPKAFVATPKQVELMGLIAGGRYQYIGFGGAIRGTKTWGSLAALIALCRLYPGSRWAIVRQDLPTLRRNTIPSFNKLRSLARNFVGEINQSVWTAQCMNGSELLFFPEGLERDPDLDRWKGLEVNGFLLEEANELSEKTFSKAIERAGSWFIPPSDERPDPIQPLPLVLCTFNPAQNWVRRVFYDPWKSGTIEPPFYFLPTTIQDNPYAPESYKASLKNLPPQEYKRFVLGDWESLDDPDQLIKVEWVYHAQNIEPDPLQLGHRRLGVDVARFGDDQTVFCMVNGNSMEFAKAFKDIPIDRIARMVTTYIGEPEVPVTPEDVHIDSVGVGGGVVDILRGPAHHMRVSEVVSGAKPVPRPGSFFKFANLRSQMWWEFREKLRCGLFSLPSEIDPKLLGDLTTPRYEIKSDKVIFVETKEDIKERIGRSTDFGDALVYAAFDMPRRQPAVIAPSYSRRDHRV